MQRKEIVPQKLLLTCSSLLLSYMNYVFYSHTKNLHRLGFHIPKGIIFCTITRFSWNNDLVDTFPHTKLYLIKRPPTLVNVIPFFSPFLAATQKNILNF